MPSATLQEIVEYRGVEGLVAAEVLTDDEEASIPQSMRSLVPPL